MNKRLCVVMLLVLVLALGSQVALAQDGDEEELVCDAFPSAATDVRTSYYMGEGIGYFASGQLTAARDSFSCIIQQVDPGYVPAYMSRAAIYTERRSFELALEDYNRALELRSGYPPAYNNRGIVYAAQGEYELALADFNEAITRDSGFVIGYINRAVIYAIQGEYGLAIADLDQALAVSGLPGVVEDLTDPDRPDDAEPPVYNADHARAYAILGIVYSMQAQDNYENYLLLTGSQADRRIQSAAGALESRFSFDLRLDDGTWLFTAAFSIVEG
ncbi:MAG: tetratricopeptide repeat protein [Chloroflexi bacterium]|nr:tetratricopeptide repeat protein [Chloroflexota bacterium]